MYYVFYFLFLNNKCHLAPKSMCKQNFDFFLQQNLNIIFKPPFAWLSFSILRLDCSPHRVEMHLVLSSPPRCHSSCLHLGGKGLLELSWHWYFSPCSSYCPFPFIASSFASQGCPFPHLPPNAASSDRVLRGVKSSFSQSILRIFCSLVPGQTILTWLLLSPSLELGHPH